MLIPSSVGHVLLLYREYSDCVGCRDWSTESTPVRRRRNALPITDTELKLIASAAISGDNSQPVIGYNTPAAIGMPNAL